MILGVEGFGSFVEWRDWARAALFNSAAGKG